MAALPFVAVLLASGAWAKRRFGRFARLPSHFGLSGKADAFAPRQTMIWMLPLLFSAVLVAIAVLVIVLPAEQQSGDGLAAVMVGGGALVGAQLFVLWLTGRWAREQPTD